MSKMNKTITQNLFIKEMMAVQNVSHPNIMGIRGICYDNLNFYIEAELCEGGELADRLSQIKHFTENKAAYILH